MATHFSILAWEIPCPEDPGEVSWGRTESDNTEQLNNNMRAGLFAYLNQKLLVYLFKHNLDFIFNIFIER